MLSIYTAHNRSVCSRWMLRSVANVLCTKTLTHTHMHSYEHIHITYSFVCQRQHSCVRVFVHILDAFNARDMCDSQRGEMLFYIRIPLCRWMEKLIQNSSISAHIYLMSLTHAKYCRFTYGSSDMCG